MIKDQTYFYSEEFNGVLSDLIQKAGLPAKFSLQPLKGGRNNRVFCVVHENGLKALLKAYFQHPNDLRNRLRTEYSFMNFAWNHNIRCLPRPISADFKNNLGLYEFIEGRQLDSFEINDEKIKQALIFFFEINKYKNAPEAKKLPIASEACFSIKEHISAINSRVKKLEKIDDVEANRKALFFIKNELLPKWEKTIEHVNKYMHQFNIEPDENMSKNEICISPSDFGYHNALLKENRLHFIDFEYAGWDDPAKMVCDFFCQPEVKVPFKYFDSFVEAVGNMATDPLKFKQKINALLPLYKIKWCCILLNEFLEIGSERRNFAYGMNDLQQEKINQLEKARRYLESFNSNQ